MAGPLRSRTSDVVGSTDNERVVRSPRRDGHPGVKYRSRSTRIAPSVGGNAPPKSTSLQSTHLHWQNHHRRQQRRSHRQRSRPPN
eukprot:362492-Chlamydomonas_euryale.AAC.2